MKKSILYLAAAAVLSACGGGSGGGGIGNGDILGPAAQALRGDSGARSARSFQVVSFGDSLSDVGTHEVTGAPVGPLRFHGGRFTTNPGNVWTERVARFYGNELKPAAKGGFGEIPVAAGGLGYAQGGAQLSTVFRNSQSGMVGKSVSAQIDTFLEEHHVFDEQQLVLIQGGTLELVSWSTLAAAKLVTADKFASLVDATAVDLAKQVGRLTLAGARRVVVANIADLGQTPMATRLPEIASKLTEATRRFNATLAAELDRQPKPPQLLQLDTFEWMRKMASGYREQGFQVRNSDVACSKPKILALARQLGVAKPDSFVQDSGMSVLCSADTLTQAGADQTYMYADLIHPSGRLQELYARFAESEIDKKLP